MGYCTTSNIEDPAESRGGFPPKDLQVPAAWSEDEEAGKQVVGKDGEAGKHVKFHSHGGIMGYISELRCGKS